MSVNDHELWDEFSAAVDHLHDAKERWALARKTGTGEAAAEKDFRDAQASYDEVASKV